MPTCGECVYLVKNKSGAYVCAGRLSVCISTPTPQDDASHCLKFEKRPAPPAGK